MGDTEFQFGFFDFDIPHSLIWVSIATIAVLTTGSGLIYLGMLWIFHLIHELGHYVGVLLTSRTPRKLSVCVGNSYVKLPNGKYTAKELFLITALGPLFGFAFVLAVMYISVRILSPINALFVWGSLIFPTLVNIAVLIDGSDGKQLREAYSKIKEESGTVTINHDK